MSEINRGKIEEAVTMILEALGEDPTREGLLDTPKRVAKMYEEVFSGMRQVCEIAVAEHSSVRGTAGFLDL